MKTVYQLAEELGLEKKSFTSRALCSQGGLQEGFGSAEGSA